jgi:aquaporin Z
LFWLAPIVGAVIAGASYALITGEKVAAQIEGEARA